jgi:hypothetical protein
MITESLKSLYKDMLFKSKMYKKSSDARDLKAWENAAHLYYEHMINLSIPRSSLFKR